MRPVLFASRPHETVQKVRWGDGHWAALPPGRAVFEEEDGVIYMAMSLQNVGTGIAVILGWRVDTGQLINPNASSEEMRPGRRWSVPIRRASAPRPGTSTRPRTI